MTLTIDTSIIHPDHVNPLTLDTRKTYAFLLHFSESDTVEQQQWIISQFFQAFSADDNVCLVLNASPEQLKNITEDLAAENQSSELLILKHELSSRQELELIMACQVYIHHRETIDEYALYALALNKKLICLKSPSNLSLKDAQVRWMNPDESEALGYVMKKLSQSATTPNNIGRNYIKKNFDPNIYTVKQLINTRVTCLFAWGSSGSKFFQTLLDSHPEVLMLPFNSIVYFHTSIWPALQALIRQPDFSILPFIEKVTDMFTPIFDGSKIPEDYKLTQLGENRNQVLRVETKAFKKYLLEILKALFRQGYAINRHLFFISLHYAYALAANQDVRKKSLIVYHLHSLENYEEMALTLDDFPRATMMVTHRVNPIAAFHSNLNHGRKYIASLPDQENYSLEDMVIDGEYQKFYRHLLIGNNNMKRRYDLSTYYVELETLHLAPEDTLRNICHWLKIEWHPCLLESTVNGLKYWWGSGTETFSGFSATHHQKKKWKETTSLLDRYVTLGLMAKDAEKFSIKISSLHKWLTPILIFKPTKMELRALTKHLLKHDFETCQHIIVNILSRYWWSYQHLFGQEIHSVFKITPLDSRRETEYLEEKLYKQQRKR